MANTGAHKGPAPGSHMSWMGPTMGPHMDPIWAHIGSIWGSNGPHMGHLWAELAEYSNHPGGRLYYVSRSVTTSKLFGSVRHANDNLSFFALVLLEAQFTIRQPCKRNWLSVVVVGGGSD